MGTNTPGQTSGFTLLLATVMVGFSSTSWAATVSEDIDLFVLGDDETVTVLFDNDFLPNEPMELWFDGFAENLDTNPLSSNGLDVELRAGGVRVTDTVRLPPLLPSEPVPVNLHVMLSSSPSQIGLRAEGLGCCDNIHVFGSLTRTGLVPEPSGLLLAAIGMGMVLVRRLGRSGQGKFLGFTS